MNAPACGCGVCRADRAVAKTARALIAMLAIVILIFATAGTVAATTEHCDGGIDAAKYEASVDGEFDGVVLLVGTSFCVKGATDATDVLVSDGTTSLFDYLGNGHSVSYYVVYAPLPLPPENACKDQCEIATPEPGPSEGIGEPASTENPDPAVVVPPEQRPLSPVAYPDGAGQPPLPDTAMNPGWSDSQKVLYVIGSILFIIGLRITLRALFQRR